MSLLTIENLQFAYDKKQVLSNLFLNVEAHQVYGFIGRNGAGKTTTIHCLLGYLKPQSGVIIFDGKPIDEDRLGFKGNVSFVSDVPSFPPFYKATEYLRFVGELYHVQDLNQRIQEVLESVELSGIPQPIGSYSRGMRQRLAIGAAILSRPKLLIMDEPTSALDPLGRDAVLSMMQTLKKTTTILYSTHILEDAERVSDRIGIIENGRLMKEGPLQELLKTDEKRYRLVLEKPLINPLPFEHQITADHAYEILLDDVKDKERLWLFLQHEGCNVEVFQPVRKTLTSLYYEVIHENAH